MSRSALLLLLILSFSPDTAAALSLEGPAADLSAAGGYCDYVSGVADSDRALLLSPQLFVNFGILNGAGFLSTDIFTPPPTTLRLTIGLRYSASRLYQGVLLRARARAECQRYAAVNQLLTFVHDHSEHTTRGALQARAAVLRDSLPRADAILAELRSAVSRHTATIEELDGALLRADRLRADLEQTAGRLAGLRDATPLKAPIPALQQSRARAEEAVDRYEADLRRSQGWDVTIQGGYDQIFGAVNQVPLFGMVSLSVNPGMIWQGRANARARAGRLRWAATRAEGGDSRAARLLAELAAQQRSERERLRAVDTMVSELSVRMKELEAFSDAKIRRYRDHVWFDLAVARAEQAYLRAHITDLGELGVDTVQE